MDACSGRGMGGNLARWGWATQYQQFIVMMIPHHDGAIAMAGMISLLTKSRGLSIKALAKRASRAIRKPRRTAQIAPFVQGVVRPGVSPWGLARAGRWQGGDGAYGNAEWEVDSLGQHGYEPGPPLSHRP